MRRYSPDQVLRWATSSVVLSPGGVSRVLKVRSQSFDLLLPVGSFIEVLPELETAGVDLYLMSREVPPTLTLEGLNSSDAARVMAQNGVVAHFDLPHPNEVAILSGPSLSLLQEWASGPLQSWVQQ